MNEGPYLLNNFSLSYEHKSEFSEINFSLTYLLKKIIELFLDGDISKGDANRMVQKLLPSRKEFLFKVNNRNTTKRCKDVQS